MHLQLIHLPYSLNAMVKYFAPFINQPWSMLLHSGYSNHPDSRYDILVAAPLLTLTTRNGITEVHDGRKSELYYDDPFLLVQKKIAEVGIKTLPNINLPFQGGAVGFFGYDLIRNIEVLPVLAKQDLPLPEMAIGIYQWALIADHKQRTIVLVSHDDPMPILAQFYNVTSVQSTESYSLGPWYLNMTRKEYSSKFQKVQEHLLAGNCYQICLSQRFSAPFNGDEWLVFCFLLNYNKAPFSAFIKLTKHQAVLSLSPERFLRLRNGKIQSRPIKGTLPRLTNAKADSHQILRLATSIKDQAENLMIVDLLRNDIGKVAQPGSVYVPSLFAIETFTAVHHMVSTIEAILELDYTPCDLMRACFPGGSITGAPKIKAMEIIEHLEPHRRSVWCGSIGYISFCGSMDMNIAIRTLLVVNQHIYCYVGSGIIADSNEEMEYRETLTKAASLLPSLQKFNV